MFSVMIQLIQSEKHTTILCGGYILVTKHKADRFEWHPLKAMNRKRVTETSMRNAMNVFFLNPGQSRKCR